ncbi:MAG: transketolase [Deltaproteobacteria bacterium]|nr:MAG: transketolase [Deltaproteobacteria bacterium]
MPTLTPELQRKCIDTIRFLAVDAVENANSGHPGLPMGAAPMAFVLWTRHLRFNPNDPRWAGRDRFILSAGHGSMLLYALLHLAGFKVSIDDLKRFRQLHSNTPGHPEFGDTDGVEATTGPLGQGVANAVGFALSQKMLAARLGEGALDTTVYSICSDGDLMEGVASEASSLAGHLGLGNLILLYDDNHVSLAGHTEITFTEDRLGRYAAYGWHTLRVEDGNDVEAIDRAIATARAVKDRPSIISVRTVLGYGAPTKANTHEAHGSPLGKDEVRRTKENLGWPLEPTFLVPDDVRAFWAGRVEELKKDYEAWQKRFAQWRSSNADKARVFDQLASRAVPGNLADELVKVVAAVKEADSTRKVASSVLQKAAELVPALVGGSADLDPSTLTYLKDKGDVGRGQYGGRNIHFGVREHGMGSIVNGFAYDGFFLPYSGTFLVFSDYMRPPIRISALSKLRSIFVFTHDSVLLGEDGPTHQPIEHLAALRAIPNIQLWRPGDPLEVAASWAAALERDDGPTVLVFTRQKLPPLQRATPGDIQKVLRGAYALVEPQLEAGEDPELCIVATGSELPVAQSALGLLDSRLAAKTRLVSMPCVERFLSWNGDAQRKLIPHDTKTKLVAVEAAGGLDWYRIIGDGLMVGIDRFGASAPEKAIADAFGLTPQKVAGRIQKWLQEGARTNTKR